MLRLCGWRVLAAGAALALLSVSAYADDKPGKAYAMAGYTWTGFYAGLNAGYGWGTPGKTFLGLPDVPGLWTNYNPVVNGLANPRVDGFIGGFQFGYNYQINTAVLGIEADFNFSGIKGSQNTPTTSLGGTAFSFAESRNLKWFSTVRGRLGWAAAERILIYATGGLAFGKVENFTSLTFALPPNFSYNGPASQTKTGWTIGGGVEWALARNWSVKTEYLYYDLGSVRVIAVANPGVAANGSQTDIKTNGSLVRVGINYLFH